MPAHSSKLSVETNLSYNLGYSVQSVLYFLTESANREGLGLTFRLCFSYSQCFPFWWNQPIKMDFGYRLVHNSLRVSALLIPLQYLYTLFRTTSLMVIRLMISLHTANTVEATWKHVKFSLCTPVVSTACTIWQNTCLGLFAMHFTLIPS